TAHNITSKLSNSDIKVFKPSEASKGEYFRNPNKPELIVYGFIVKEFYQNLFNSFQDLFGILHADNKLRIVDLKEIQDKPFNLKERPRGVECLQSPLNVLYHFLYRLDKYSDEEWSDI